MPGRLPLIAGVSAGAIAAVAATLVLKRGDNRPADSPTSAASSVVVDRGDIAPVLTLHDGRVVTSGRYLARRSTGSFVAVRADGLLVSARVPPELVYRFARPVRRVRAQLVGGPGPTACAPLGWIGAGVAPIALAGGVVLCRLPAGSPAVPGQPASVEVALALRAGVLRLPVEAVAGTLDRGQVAVVRGGTTTVIPVDLGASDGLLIEIRSGLREGDTVRVPGPSLAGFDERSG